MRLWHAADGTPIRTLSEHEYAVYAVAFSPNGEVVAAGGVGGKVRLWQVMNGLLVNTLTDHAGLFAQIRGLAFSPDGRTLASAATDKTIRLWRAE